jgi:virginiamycin B lyase
MIGMPTSGTNPTEVGIPIANSTPEGIVVANGNLWVVLSTASVIEEFSVTTQAFVPLTLTANSDPQEIVNGPNNNLWFTEDGATSQAIGELTTAGVLVGTFPLANVTFGG